LGFHDFEIFRRDSGHFPDLSAYKELTLLSHPDVSAYNLLFDHRGLPS
jgi:hypothetical protein